jgi:type IV pilus assembly protein PilA
MVQYLAKFIKGVGRDKKGFTLVELMAVLAVLSIIAAIAVPRFTGTIETAKLKADMASALIIARAAEQLWLDEGKDEDETYTEEQLVDGYVSEIKWQNSSTEGVTAIVNKEGECTGVYYGDETTGLNLLTGEKDQQ